MMPLRLSVVAWLGADLGKSTWAADSIVTAVVTMKMISRTRKISVSGVILMSANTPPPFLPVIFPLAMRKYLYGQRSTTTTTAGVGHLRIRGPLGRDRNLFGARTLGDVQNPHHIAQQHFAIALEHDDLLVHLAQCLAQTRLELALGHVLGVHEQFVLGGVSDDDALVLRRRVGCVRQIDVRRRLDSHRSRHHEDDQQNQENV